MAIAEVNHPRAGEERDDHPRHHTHPPPRGFSSHEGHQAVQIEVLPLPFVCPVIETSEEVYLEGAVPKAFDNPVLTRPLKHLGPRYEHEVVGLDREGGGRASPEGGHRQAYPGAPHRDFRESGSKAH